MYSLQCTTEKKEGLTFLHIQGRIDANSSGKIEEKFKEILEIEHQAVIVDLSRVDYVSSAGLRLMIAATKKFQGKGVRLLFCHMLDEVREIIKMAGFETILDIYSSEREALASLKK